MKKLLNLIRDRVVIGALVLVMITNVLSSVCVFASGPEPLPYGSHNIGPFTFTNTNTTPVKTVKSSKVYFSILFVKAPKDATGKFITSPYTVAQPTSIFTTPTYNLGKKGRKIHIWFDASSVGTSNGKYRSIKVLSYASYVS